MNARIERLTKLAFDRGWRDLAGNLRHIGHLLSGNVLSNALALVSLAVAARALTTEEFGVLVMVVAYVRLVERLIRFESWQPLIHFASHLEQDSSHKLPRLYLLGLILDVSAALLATIAAILIAYVFGFAFGLPASALTLVAIFSSGVLFNITGVPTAALRLGGRFKTIAYVQPFAAILRIPLALFCWYYSSDLQSFVVAWLAAQVAGSCLFVFMGYRALVAQSIRGVFKSSPRGLLREFPGFVGFAWSTNLSMTLRTVTQEADVLLVGFLAGPGSAGFYHVAKRLAKVAQQLGAHTQAVFYPSMARLWAAREYVTLRSLTLRVQLVLAGIGLTGVAVAALLGQTFVDVAIGDRYADVAPLLVAQMVAVTLVMYAAPARSVLLSMGRPNTVLLSVSVGTLVFFICATLMIPTLGAMGASLSQIVLAALIAMWMQLAWLRQSASERARLDLPPGSCSKADVGHIE